MTTPATRSNSSTDPVLVEQRGRCLIITINRPAARNAIDGHVALGIEQAVDWLESDAELWMGVITGTPPAFCAGADLKVVGDGDASLLQTQRGGFAGIAARHRSKPIVAAVNGPALAGGAEIALACDLIVASHDAVFGLPEVKRSLVAGGGGLFRLGRRIPLNVAMECALTGDPITAERASHFGLVNVLCEASDVVASAIDLAERVCSNAPLAVRASRRLVLDATTAQDDVAWQMSNDAGHDIMATADFREGVQAFLDKRAPNWTGT